MTNITLSVDKSVRRRMKKYSEVKWSDYIRRAIRQRLDELDSVSGSDKESLLTMLASEEVLEGEWSNSLDSRWDDV